MSARGTTKNELAATLERILASARKRVDPNYEPTYRCSGGCQDTGWVEVGERVKGKAPTVRRCFKCGGRPPKPTSSRGGSFS